MWVPSQYLDLILTIISALILYNHYRESLRLIKEISAELPLVQDNLGITDEDFEQYIQDERSYLLSLTGEPPQETLRYQYVEALQELAKYKYD